MIAFRKQTVTRAEFKRLHALGHRPRKLSTEKARAIRRGFFHDKRKQRELGLEFDVSQSVISKVVSEQIWGSK